jgi:hypothetical protein
MRDRRRQQGAAVVAVAQVAGPADQAGLVAPLEQPPAAERLVAVAADVGAAR